MTRKLDVARLIDDLGKPAEVALRMGLRRNAAYRWINTGKISVENLNRLKSAFPDVRLDDYFIQETNDDKEDAGSCT